MFFLVTLSRLLALRSGVENVDQDPGFSSRNDHRY